MISPKQIENLLLFLYGVIVFFLTRQVPFDRFSWISNIAVMVMLLYSIRYKTPSFIILALLPLVGYSMAMGNSPSNIIRFFIILSSLISAYFIILDCKKVLKILFIITLIQCSFIILFELYLMLFGSPVIVSSVRFFLISRNWGDAYTFGGLFYKIQLKGNGLLPFVYMLSYTCSLFPYRYKWHFRVLYAVTIFFSGQFAFLISIVLFHVLLYSYKHLSDALAFIKRFYLAILVGLVLFVPVSGYVTETMERKKDMSTATRIDQIGVLLDDVSTSPLTLTFGTGLGHTIEQKTAYRDYRGLTYYEIQFLYVLNQLGFLFVFYAIVHFLLALNKIGQIKLLLVYLCYVCYACTNPYMLDTNQFVVILTLCSVSYYDRSKNGRKNNICSGSLQS